jgi:hypothetical protein
MSKVTAIWKGGQLEKQETRMTKTYMKFVCIFVPRFCCVVGAGERAHREALTAEFEARHQRRRVPGNLERGGKRIDTQAAQR